MAAWTIRSRLTRSLVLMVTVLWIAGVAVAGLVMHHELDEVFDSALRETTGQLIPVAIHEYRLQRGASPLVRPAEADILAFKSRRGHVHFYLQDPQGAVVLASNGAPDHAMPKPLTRGFYDLNGFRYYRYFLPAEGLWIVVAQELHERHEAAVGLWLGLASPLLILLPLFAFATWKTVGRAADAIAGVSREVQARSGEHLEPISIGQSPGELVPVIEATNTLMDRLKSALDAERAFAANAAHELRNPVASARAQIQLLAANLDSQPDRVRAENIASQLGQLGRRVEKLLQISRAEAGLGPGNERCDLLVIGDLVVDEFRRQPGVGPRLVCEGDDAVARWVPMDPDAVAIVLRNVIENAVCHGNAEGLITVRFGEGARVVISSMGS
jgi:two-component system, OmpR family, sensor kinase